MAVEQAVIKQAKRLDKYQELRMEVDPKAPVSIVMTSGQAEVFGTDLLLGQKVTLRGQKIAVYTWQGCTLDIEGQPSVMYESDETPMRLFLNTHAALEEKRQAARTSGGQGPRCMVVGPVDVGKSSLCKILLNYAVRMAWTPTYVDLDLGQGMITCPGCVAATPVESPIDIEEDMVGGEVPLVYFYGHASPSDNPDLYRHVVEQLAGVLNKRADASADVRSSGMVINWMGFVEELGYSLLLHAAQVLQVDVMLVVGQDRLYSQLQGSVSSFSPSVQLVKLPKSGGVVSRDRALRQDARTNRIRYYYEGLHGELVFHSITVPMSQLHIFRLPKGDKTPTSALPVGAQSMRDPLKVSPVIIGTDLIHTLCAVSHAKTPDQLLTSNVAGFVYIENVDTAKGTVTYRSPSMGSLPGLYLLAGTIKVVLT